MNGMLSEFQGLNALIASACSIGIVGLIFWLATRREKGFQSGKRDDH